MSATCRWRSSSAYVQNVLGFLNADWVCPRCQNKWNFGVSFHIFSFLSRLSLLRAMYVESKRSEQRVKRSKCSGVNTS
eukprot:7722448-Pyramimonas_sp.AAC.1